MGTADELALDILLNALSTFSREQLGIRQVVVGGQNEDWPVPKASLLPLLTTPCDYRGAVRVHANQKGAGWQKRRARGPALEPPGRGCRLADYRAAQPLADCLYTGLPLVLACQPALPATLDCPNPSCRPAEAPANAPAEEPVPAPGARAHMPCLKPCFARPILLPAA